MAFPEFNPNCIIDYYEDNKRREERYRDIFVKELEKAGVFALKDFQGHSPDRARAEILSSTFINADGKRGPTPTLSHKGVYFCKGQLSEKELPRFCDYIKRCIQFIFESRGNYLIELDGQPQNMFIDGDYCAEIARRYKNYTNEELPEEDMKIIKGIHEKRKKMNPLGVVSY